jgi:hypothetical protein
MSVLPLLYLAFGEHRLSLYMHIVKLQHSMLRPSLPVPWMPADAGFR